MKIFVAILSGIAIGILTSRYIFVNSALGLIPWTLVGLLLGIWAANRIEALRLGALYGFFLLFSFMFGGYQGAASEASRILPFAALGLIGAAYGLIVASIGNLLHPKQS